MRDFQLIKEYWKAIARAGPQRSSAPVFDEDIILREFTTLFDGLLWLMGSPEAKYRHGVVDYHSHWVAVWLALYRRNYDRGALIELANDELLSGDLSDRDERRLLTALDAEINSVAMKSAHDALVDRLLATEFHGEEAASVMEGEFEIWRILAIPKHSRLSIQQLLEGKVVASILWKTFDVMRREIPKVLRHGKHAFLTVLSEVNRGALDSADQISVTQEVVSSVEVSYPGGVLFSSDGPAAVRHYKALFKVLFPLAADD
jgi:hypothetical protein